MEDLPKRRPAEGQESIWSTCWTARGKRVTLAIAEPLASIACLALSLLRLFPHWHFVLSCFSSFSPASGSSCSSCSCSPFSFNGNPRRNHRDPLRKVSLDINPQDRRGIGPPGEHKTSPLLVMLTRAKGFNEFCPQLQVLTDCQRANISHGVPLPQLCALSTGRQQLSTTLSIGRGTPDVPFSISAFGDQSHCQ